MNDVIDQLMFKGMWQNSLDSMFLIKALDDEYYVEDINPVLEQAIGSASSALSGQLIKDLLPDPDAVIERYRTCLQYKQTIYYEEEGKTPTGDTNYWHTMLVPLHHGGVDYLLGSSRKVNDLKYAEREAAKARDAAETSNAAKTLFLTNMSHELRTPLNGIMGAASLLQRTTEGRGDVSQLDLIINSASTMNRLVEDILDLSKMANSRLRITPAPCNLRETIADVAALFKEAVAAKTLAYQTVISPEFPARLIADETRVRQIIINLVSNAVKFTDQGSVTLRVNFVPDDLPLLPMSGLLKIEVADTGSGIPADQLANLGTPFFQVDPARNRQQPGSGIGLSVCYSLVELMSGTLNISSIPEEGTITSVEIPLCAAESAQHPTATRPTLQLPAKFRALVVEDNVANQMILKRMLQYIGVHVTLANDGEVAVALCANEVFDLILMDLHMPNLDGIAATHVIRETGVITPIVAVTASVTERERAACRRAEMNDFVEKPVKLAAVEAMLFRMFPAEAE